MYVIYFFLYKLLIKDNKRRENTFYWYLSLIAYLLFLIIKIIFYKFQISIILFNDISLSLLFGMMLPFFNVVHLRGISKFIYFLLLIFFHFLYIIRYSNIFYILISLVCSILCTFKYSFGKLNCFFTYLGKHSLSFYLLHIIPLKLFRSNIIYINNFYIYLIIYIVVLVIISYFFEKIVSRFKVIIIKILEFIERQKYYEKR